VQNDPMPSVVHQVSFGLMRGHACYSMEKQKLLAAALTRSLDHMGRAGAVRGRPFERRGDPHTLTATRKMFGPF
jgi:hypothetical protein